VCAQNTVPNWRDASWWRAGVAVEVIIFETERRILHNPTDNLKQINLHGAHGAQAGGRPVAGGMRRRMRGGRRRPATGGGLAAGGRLRISIRHLFLNKITR